MKGDRVEIVIDTGGSAETYEIVATRAGRTGRFMATRVIALVEHPASDEPVGAEESSRRRRPRAEQAETLL
jgi:hypothetical protein